MGRNALPERILPLLLRRCNLYRDDAPSRSFLDPDVENPHAPSEKPPYLDILMVLDVHTLLRFRRRGRLLPHFAESLGFAHQGTVFLDNTKTRRRKTIPGGRVGPCNR